MMVGRIFISAMIIFTATVAVAQEGPEATPTPDLATVSLLEEVPNYAEILAHQWSEGVGAVGTAAENDWDSYGRLLDTGTPQSLTLSDCIVLALQNNTGLKVERLGPLSARAGVRSARAIFDPAFFAEVGKDRAVIPSDSLFYDDTVVDQNFKANVGLRKLLLSGGEAELQWNNRRNRSNFSYQGLDPDYIAELTLSLSQPLLRDFGLRYATILVRIAETAELQAIRNYEAQVAKKIKTVEELYWDLVQAIQNVRVQKQALAAAEELLRQNEGKFEVGALPRTAVLEAGTKVAQYQALLIRVQNAETVAGDNLRAFLNVRSEETEALILIDPSQRPEVGEDEIELETSLTLARERRPELQAAQLEVHAKALSLKASENQLLPRLDAVVAIGTHGLAGDAVDGTGLEIPGLPSPEPSRFKGNYGDSLNLLTDGRYYSYMAGVFLEIPLTNAQARADYATAKVDLERARLNFGELQQRVTWEVKTAISNLQSDLKSIEATRIARELAEENVHNQQARYDVGLATTKDLLDFQDQLTRARAAEVDSLTRYNTDLAELRRVEGTLLAARNVVLDVLPKERAPWWARF